MNKRQAMRTFADSGGLGVPYNIEGVGSISYTTAFANSIKALRIEGDMNYMNGVNSPVGIATDDGAIIKLRIHGETALDGHELERIMKERGSPCYGGVVDDEHFLYIARDDASYTLIDRTDMYIPNNTISIIGEAILYNPLPEGKTATGMQIIAGGGGWAISFSGTEGAVSFSGHNGNNRYNYALMHKAVESEFSYAIAYNSLRIVQNGNVTEAPYNGYICEIKVSAPLYRIYGAESEVYDELDVISGVLTRRVAVVSVGECKIIEAYYMGIPCFILTVPSPVKDHDRISCDMLYESDDSCFFDCVDSFMRIDNQSVYLNLGEDVTTVEEARAHLGENSIITYPRADEIIEEVTPETINTDSGNVVIEVCSVAPAKIYATYKG